MTFEKATFTFSRFITLFLASIKEMLKELWQIINKALIPYTVEEAVSVNLDNELHFDVLEKNGSAGIKFTEGQKQLKYTLRKKPRRRIPGISF